jgi:hypothetical protein
MAYFQNLFDTDFVQAFCLSDRQYNISFKVPANKNRSTQMDCWNPGPWNLTGSNKFAIRFSLDSGRNYTTISFTLTAGSAVTAQQVVADMNANTTFANWFTAEVVPDRFDNRVRIRALTKVPESFRAYIPNTADTGDATNTAEQHLQFNLRAAVVELPSYLERHTIANQGTYADGLGMLLKLTQSDENWVITNAGLSTTPKSDYELLRGRSGAFMFVKNTVDSSSRITQSIEYPAGAVAGDLARKTTYSYTGAKTAPDQSAQVPYTLTGGDLITP